MLEGLPSQAENEPESLPPHIGHRNKCDHSGDPDEGLGKAQLRCIEAAPQEHSPPVGPFAFQGGAAADSRTVLQEHSCDKLHVDLHLSGGWHHAPFRHEAAVDASDAAGNKHSVATDTLPGC